jgi:hypothetical protein
MTILDVDLQVQFRRNSGSWGKEKEKRKKKTTANTPPSRYGSVSCSLRKIGHNTRKAQIPASRFAYVTIRNISKVYY